MKNKTITLFLLLNKDEKERLKDWLIYQKAPKITQKLVLQLCRCPAIQEQELQKVFGNKPSDGYFRKCLSELNQYIVSYIASIDLLEQPNLVQNLVNERLQQNSASIQQKNTYEDAYCHIAPFWQQSTILEQYTKIKSEEHNIRSILYHLDYFYIVEVLFYQLTWLTQQELYTSASPNIVQIQAIQVLLSSHTLPSNSLINVLLLAIALQQYKEESVFMEIKIKFVDTSILIPTKIRMQLFLILLNYTVKQSNKGIIAYTQEALQLYQLGFEKYYFGKTISPTTYRNSIGLAIKGKDVALAADFIKHNTNYLPQEYQLSNSAYCNAWINVEKKEYRKAKKELLSVTFEDSILALNSKVMLLKIYYEEKDWNSLDSLLESGISYIRRKKIKGNYKAYFLLLFQYTKKLITTYSKTPFLHLHTKIEKDINFAAKDWLLIKLHERME